MLLVQLINAKGMVTGLRVKPNSIALFPNIFIPWIAIDDRQESVSLTARPESSPLKNPFVSQQILLNWVEDKLEGPL
jgi:hypothetical protein